MKTLAAVLLVTLASGARAQTAADARAVEVYRAGLLAAAADMRTIAAEVQGELLTAEEKRRVRTTWAAFLDYLLVLDSIGAHHRERKGAPALAISYASFLAQYRGALQMIDAARRLPGADVVLDEPVPAIGVGSGTFAKLKLRWLNVARATEYAALESLYRVRRGHDFHALHALIEEDAAEVLRAGRGKGPLQTMQNAVKIARSTAFTAWFPVQKGVAEWMGDTRVARKERFLVTPRQIAALAPRLEPGDVLLERREWYVSNVGLPGFWPHTALYIGDAAQRRRYFDDEGVRAWVREQGRADGDFEASCASAHRPTRGRRRRR